MNPHDWHALTQALRLTAELAALTTVLLLAVGTPIAWWLAHTRSRLKGLVGAVVALREHGHLGTDVLVSRLPAAGKKVCLMLAQIAMLYVSWLLLKGSWAQMVINADTEAPVTGASVGIFYASGVLMGGSAIAILLRDLLRTLDKCGGDAFTEAARNRIGKNGGKAVQVKHIWPHG